MKSDWIKLNKVSFSKLTDARKQLHQAVQIVSMPPRAFLPEVKDDHFASLRWNKKYNALESQHWEKNKTVLSFSDFSIYLLDKKNNIINKFCLDSVTYKKAFIMLKEIISSTGENADKLSLSLPYEIPVYPTAEDELFSFFEKNYFIELCNYFANAHSVLEEVLKNNSEATEISCWPHHFDMATLLVINNSSENYKSIGVGLSPGDENYDQPYFYITPWPYPNIGDITLPGLPSGGFWHTKGWVGAILTASEILKYTSSDKQQNAVKEFINMGIKENKALL